MCVVFAADHSPQSIPQLGLELAPECRHACLEVLEAWTQRLVSEAERAFPVKVTAFRPEMAAHGKHKEPCPQCGDPIQRIVYATRETNYCATCQTGGKVLADRSLSRLLGKDWPRTIEELEKRRPGRDEATADADPLSAS